MGALIKKVARMPHRLSRMGLKSYCAVHDAIFEAGPKWGVEPSATQLKNIACHPEIPYGTFPDGHPDWVQNAAGLWVLSFDGADKVTIPHTSSQLIGTQNFSVKCWFYVTDPTVTQVFLSKMFVGATEDYQLYFRIASTKLQLTTRDITDSGGGVYTSSITGLLTVSANTWYQAWAVRIGLNLYLYLNGAPDNNAVTPAIRNLIMTDPIYLGVREGNVGTFTQYLTGGMMLWEVKIGAVSASFVANSYWKERAWFGV